MRNKFLVIALLLISYQLLAQESSHASIVYDNNTNLSWKNFPAISEDGLFYLIIYNEYSCCIDTGNILQQRSVTTGEISDEIVLSPNETEQIEFTGEDKIIIFKEVQKVLKDEHYFTLSKVKKYEKIMDKDNNELFIKTSLKNQLYISKKFKVPQSKLHGFCCTGDYDSKESCVVNQSIDDVWLSEKHQLLLIQSSASHLANGCDDGPYYKIVSLIKQ